MCDIATLGIIIPIPYMYMYIAASFQMPNMPNYNIVDTICRKVVIKTVTESGKVKVSGF